MQESEVLKIALFRLRELTAQIDALAAQATSDAVRETLRAVNEAVREQERQIAILTRE